MTEIGKYYNHDPKHFNFQRSMDHHNLVIEKSGSKLWLVAAIVAFVLSTIVIF